jgi:lysozyme family protein
MLKMADFKKALHVVLNNEQGLSDDPNDPGGITNKGISLRFLKSIDPNATKEDIIGLTDEKIHDLYYQHFWLASPFEQIPYQQLCNVLFDGCVTTGIAPTIKCLQRAIWAATENFNHFHDDGIMGEQTIQYIRKLGYRLLAPLRSERASLYRQISHQFNNENKYLKDWLYRAYMTG